MAIQRKIIKMPSLEVWQKDVYDAVDNSRGSGKIFVTVSKRQIGKSFLLSTLLIKSCLEKEQTISCCIEPTQAQNRKVFQQITDMLDGSNVIVSANASILEIEFVNKSRIIFKSAEQKEHIRGFSVNGILCIDEAAFIADDVIEILFPLCDAHRAPIFMVSTPLFTEGLFYTLYIKGLDEKVTKIESFNWCKYDTSKYLTAESLEMYRQTLTANKFRTEYLGEFLTDGSFVFGNIRECIGYGSKLPLYAGIDWASGKDGDDTVVTLIDEDGTVVAIDCLNHMDATAQIDRIVQFLRQYPSLEKIQVETNSIGSVFLDMLKSKYRDRPILEFCTSNESKRRIVEQLIKAFENKTIKIPDDKKLIEELQHYEMQKLAKGYTYNAQGIFHDDYVLSLALAYDMVENNNGSYTFSFGRKRQKIKRLRDRYE